MHLSNSTICPQRCHRIITLSLGLLLGLSVFIGSSSDTLGQRRQSALGKKESEDKNRTPQANTRKQNPSASQRGSNQRVPASPRQRKPGEEDEFAPQRITMDVKKEGIQLVATWFPPIIEDKSKKKKKNDEEAETDPGKSVAPFILVHEWSRSRNDLLAMGAFLQSMGHAVIVPDLRGHGESTAMAGSTKPIDYKNLKKASDKASAVRDIDQCKRFLQEKNNEGILNIDLLNVVAVGDSAHLAVAWAISDWSWESVAGIKQGKDVKSLILFSPSKKFAGSALKKVAKEPLVSGRSTAPIPMLVIWGGQSAGAKTCNDFVKTLRKFREEAPEGDDMATRWFKQNLFHFQAPTAMQGYELAGSPSARQLWSFANDFVSQKVLAFKDQCPWQLRGTEEVLKARDRAEKE